jgi:hypothetical protein
MDYTVIYYETKTVECPVQDFINSRKEKNQVKIINQIELLEEFGPQLPRPYADILQDGFMSFASNFQVTSSGFFTFSFTGIISCLPMLLIKPQVRFLNLKSKRPNQQEQTLWDAISQLRILKGSLNYENAKERSKRAA